MAKYCVTITTYEDDYKHRWDSGVYKEEPEFFDEIWEAQKYVFKKVIEEILDHDGFGTDLDEIAEHLKEKYMKAEFVDELIDWDITEVKTKKGKKNKK